MEPEPGNHTHQPYFGEAGQIISLSCALFTHQESNVIRCRCPFTKSCPTLRPHGLQHATLPCPSTPESLLKFMSIESVMLSNHLILCRPLLLPSIFLSIRLFSEEPALRIRWSKYWSFSFSISPFNEYSGLISFRIDCFDGNSDVVEMGRCT